MPVYAVLAIVGLVVAFAWFAVLVDGVGLFAPRRSAQIGSGARAFCAQRCRRADGTCPMTSTTEQAAECPLWRYVEADLPTSVYGSPFEPVNA